MNLWRDKDFPIIVSCANTLAHWTEKELRKLGYEPVEKSENYLVVRGSLRDVLKLNLWLRTAQRVLVPLFRGKCRHVRELYDKVGSLDWENLIDADGYVTVSSVVHNNETIRDTRMPSLVVKDAIVDRIRMKTGRRPDSGGDYDLGASVFVHWNGDTVIVYIDTSGAPLSKRGYRKIPGSAPMQETLAAGCIDAMEWEGNAPFFAPMCGSGTPAIEAALKAMNPDVVGWLQVPGTVVNYPVFQTDNNEYYLDHAPDRSDSIGGSVFLDYENSAPGMVDAQTIVYGHHMRNGSQFKQIADMDDQSLFDVVKTVWYVTEKNGAFCAPQSS